MTFARNNQIRLFQKLIAPYQGTILPTKLNCVNEEIMKEIGQMYNEKGI